MLYPDAYSNPLLYLVRHGSTEANEEGLFRGHLDYPLDEDGLQAAEEAAYFLSFRPIGHLASSTLKRSFQTADVIAPMIQPCPYGGEGNGYDRTRNYDRNPGLLPWNIGYLAGKSREKYSGELQSFIDNPERVPRDGESLAEFKRRVEDIVMRYLAQATYQQPVALVTHSSFIKASHSILDPDWEDQLGVDDIVGPGGIVAVCVDAANKTTLIPMLGQIIVDNSVS